jgi:putative transposase
MTAILPPRLPKLNKYVGRAHRTHIEEFYEVVESFFDPSELKGELSQCQKICNRARPHPALSYLTLLKILEQWKQNRKKEVSVADILDECNDLTRNTYI